MNKQEALKKIEKLEGLNIKDTNFNFDIEMIPKEDVLEFIEQIDEPEKPVVPQYVADWVDNSRERDYEFCDFFDSNHQSEEVYRWLNCENRRQSGLNARALSTLIVNGRDAVMVEKETRYTVRIRNLNVENRFLVYGNSEETWVFEEMWVFSDPKLNKEYQTDFTKKELEANGFGWVFDCEGIEVEEVE